MQQLTKEEAGRVTAILRESVHRLKLLSRIPQSSKEVLSLSETALEVGLQDTSDDLAQLAGLEQQYKDAYKAAKKANPADAHVDDAVLRATYKRFAHTLRVNTKAAGLLPPEPAAKVGSRASSALDDRSPAASQTATATSRADRGDGMRVFNDRLGQLIELAGRKLVTSRDAAHDEAIEVQNKQTRIDNAEREVALLQDELRRQRAVRAKAMVDLEESLTAVRTELVSVAKGAEQELKTMQTQGSQRTTDLSAGHNKNEAGLKAQLEKLQAEYKAACEAHIDAEANIRKRKVRARAEVEAALAEHDAAVAEATKAVEEMRASITVEAGPIADLVAYYEKVDAEIARVEEEDRIEKRRIREEDEVPLFKLRVLARRMQKRYWEAKAKKDAIKELERKRKQKG